jgi:hypothetical protein
VDASRFPDSAKRNGGIMKRILVALFLITAAFSLNADWQVDIAGTVPAYIGAQVNGQDFRTAVPYAIILPTIDAHYFFGAEDDFINIGIGLRAYTFLVVHVASADVALDVNIDKLKLRAQIAGGFYWLSVMFMYNQFGTGAILFPDISAHYYITDWLGLGGGVMMVLDGSDSTPFDTNVLPYMIYGSVKFSI